MVGVTLTPRQATDEFYTGTKWVDDVDVAKDFSNLVQAVQTVVEQGINDVEIILDFGQKWETRFRR